MKRLCIYLTYDKQNIVDGYVGYMLSQLRTCVSHLVVVCNETKVVRGQDILEKYADEIFYRENIGLDVGGWKDALCCFLGWEKVFSFDELVLANDSFFGPFCPITEIFGEMEKRNVDFWGLSKHGIRKETDGTVYPPHIQSFFLTIEANMLHSIIFRDYWESMPYYGTYIDVVHEFESKFTEYFAKNGFTYDCLADMGPNDSDVIENNFNQYAFLPYELIKKRNFPFLKKQSLVGNTLHCQMQQNFKQALDYIDKETDYDINLIWDNIIRVFELSDLQRNLHLQYIVPAYKSPGIYHEDVEIVVIAEHMEAAEYVINYLEDLKRVCKIIVYSNNSNVLALYESNKYECVFWNYNRDISFLEEICARKLICIVNDSDVTGKKNPSYVGKSILYHTWNNLLKDRSHVEYIIQLFGMEQRLGLISPPEANFGNYFGNLGIKWGGYFEEVYETVKQLGLNCQISSKKPPIAVPNSFWIRGNVLKRISHKLLGKREVIKKGIIPYLWCCMVQDAGYYSGIVESAEYASQNEINLQYYLEGIIGQLRRQCGKFDTFTEMCELVSQKNIYNFCRGLKHLYIYGTGIVAKKYHKFFPECEAYVVSDGQMKETMMNGVKILYLSELQIQDDAGILVCVGEKNQDQIVPLLKEKGWKNYLCV